MRFRRGKESDGGKKRRKFLLHWDGPIGFVANTNPNWEGGRTGADKLSSTAAENGQRKKGE